MFAKTIVLSDAFLDLPMSARCLYFTLGMLADDDGFVNAPRSIMRQCGASDDDMRILIGKKFVLVFDSGVIVIKHWRINNYLRNDRYIPTKYAEEKATLALDENGAYRAGGVGIPPGIPNTGYPDKDNLGQDNLIQDSLERKKEKRKKESGEAADVCLSAVEEERKRITDAVNGVYERLEARKREAGDKGPSVGV